MNDPDGPEDTLTNIKLVDMPDRGHLMLDDKPLESVYIINFENHSLSGWERLGHVDIRPTSSQSYGPAVGFDESVAESSYALLSTDSSQSVTQIEDF